MLYKTDKVLYSVVLLCASVLFSCSNEKGFSEYDRTETYFMNQLGGEVSPAQWWKTSVTINVNVSTNEPVRLLLMSGDSKGILYDLKEVSQSGTYAMTAPQGKGTELNLVYIYNRYKSSQKITLTGKSTETISLSLSSDAAKAKVTGSSIAEPPYSTTQSIVTRSANGDAYDPDVHPSLMTSSVHAGATHFEFNNFHRTEIFPMLAMMKDNLDAKYGLGLNCDYELESNGPFNITWLAGSAGSQAEHILGYYTHSRDTYEDMEFHDLAETHKYDIIDNLAKVQYQITEEAHLAHQEIGLLPNKWYDANFDVLDVFGATTASNPARVGDKAYNSMDIINTYGEGISRIRGLSFVIDVPAGKRVGFYMKNNEQVNTEQWEQLNKMQIKGIGSRSEWKETNFCVEAFNKSQTHRSCIIPYTYSTWLGMEDRFDGGDFDCNDVLFGITSEIDIYKPSIITPDYNLMIDVVSQFPWTIAYEDVSRNADFDFNDAVIRIMPDYQKEICHVTVQAVGSSSRMYLHYDGPQGDVNLGEIHELLGSNSRTTVNTKVSQTYMPFAELSDVPWPKTYSVGTDAKRFWIEIQRGDCHECTDAITLAMEPGKMPEALLIAGEWNWPMEGAHIFSAYSNFPYWAKDANKTSYWNWYSMPKSGAVVKY